MKKTSTSFLSSMTSYAAVVALGATLIGCAHEVKKKPAPKADPVAISPSATPSSELKIQNSLTQDALTNQVDVLSADQFNESMKYFLQAIEQDKKGASADVILKSLGLARGHLLQASNEASAMMPVLEEVTNARGEALKAGARNFPANLKPLDETFKKTIVKQKGNLSQKSKTDLQNAYLALELSSIKSTKLIEVKEILNQAKIKGAAKTTPTAYAEAIAKFNIADKLIETDRHNNAKIDSTVATAVVAANRVLGLLSSEQTSRNQTPEQRAMTLEARNNALMQADSDISVLAAGSMKKSQELEAQGQALAVVKNENEAHVKAENEDKIVSDAAAKFSDSEAEVYRQDGLLIIRLKSMNFASGRSDLPATAMAVLTKVKEVIKEVGPGDVTVQGHTDGVGQANVNQKLSQNRAQAVAKFFSVDSNLENSNFDSIGYGYTKPLASNKTKEGRAQNRRVDVVIKTKNQSQI